MGELTTHYEILLTTLSSFCQCSSSNSPGLSPRGTNAAEKEQQNQNKITAETQFLRNHFIFLR